MACLAGILKAPKGGSLPCVSTVDGLVDTVLCGGLPWWGWGWVGPAGKSFSPPRAWTALYRSRPRSQRQALRPRESPGQWPEAQCQNLRLQGPPRAAVTVLQTEGSQTGIHPPPVLGPRCLGSRGPRAQLSAEAPGECPSRLFQLLGAPGIHSWAGGRLPPVSACISTRLLLCVRVSPPLCLIKTLSQGSRATLIL